MKLPLDVEYAESLNNIPGEVSFAESPFEKQQDRHYSLIGNYLVTVELPVGLVQIIDKAFYSGEKQNIESYSQISDLMRTKTRIKLKIEQKPKRVKKIRNQFVDFFGLS